MCETAEVSLPVPVQLVKKTAGISMDMGGSVLKFVYRSKENLEEANGTTKQMGHLQLVSFPKSDFQKALDYVKQRCVITRTTEVPTPEIHTTGVGCTVSGKTLCETFNIRLSNQTEFDCFHKGFTYLASHLSRKQFLHPYDDEASKEPVQTAKDQIASMMDLKDESVKSFDFQIDFTDCLGKVLNDSDEPIAEKEDVYPCIMTVCGSGFAHIMINEDKTFRIVDGSNRGGRSFFGIGSLLTGCKTFEELIELSTHGNQKNVDVFTDSLFSDASAVEGDDSMYARAGKGKASAVVYCFGKTVGAKPEDFRREDLAKSWLNYFAMDVTQSTTLLAQLLKVKRIFFCGSFCNSAFARNTLTTEIVRRNLFGKSLGFTPIQFDFIRPGAYLGALGALISEANHDCTQL